MFNRNWIWLNVMLIVLAGTLTALAAVPQLMNYQGILRAANGGPITTATQVVFTIYDAETNGNVKWTETRTVDPDTNGLFNILLGQVNPLHDSVFADSNRWLGVQVGANPEMTPRTKIATVPFAERVSTVDGGSGGKIEGDVTIAGTVYSSTGGFKFPDGSMQNTAASTGCGVPTENLYRKLIMADVSLPEETNTGADIYLTGIFVSGTGGQCWLMIKMDDLELIFFQTPLNSSLQWSSGGGAPILWPSGSTLKFQSCSSMRVVITGFRK